MDSAHLQQAIKAAANFSTDSTALDVQEIGSGNINDTFVVTGQNQPPFVLQRLSPQAFNAPELICENLEVLGRHLPAERIAALVPGRRWAIPHLLTSREDKLWWRDDNNDFWRALSYIADTTTLTCLSSVDQALEVGRALATFHSLVRDISPDALHVTIAHFHETPHYFRLYQQALAANPSCLENPLAMECRHFISEHHEGLAVLEEARSRGELTTTTIHGDPKLANILFDNQTSQACAFIDLDTLGPGLLLYDLGDCLRSCCNRGGSTYNVNSSHFDSDFCLAILTGYLEKGRQLLTSGDGKHLLAAIRLIPFELGLRFFTDYLSGCHYFKTAGPEETLQRAAAQFHLVASIDKQADSLTTEITALLAP